MSIPRRLLLLTGTLVTLGIPGSGSVAAEARPLVLWHAYRAAERTAIEATVRQWNEGARGAAPQIQLLAVPYDAFSDKITAAVPRGHGPDLFIFAHDRVGDWAESRIIEPIEFWMTEEHADQFLFKTIDALCYRDSLYGLPLAFKSTALFYNKDLVPRPPTTTDELLALGRKLTEAGAGRYGLAYDNAKLYFHAPWHFGHGGQIFDERGELRVRTPEAERGLAFAGTLGRAGGIVPPECSAVLTTSLFSQGKAAMAISGPWMLGELPASLNVGVAPLPRVSSTGRLAGPFMGAEAIMMTTHCRDKAAAFRAMTFLTSDGAAIVRALQARQPVANVAAWKDARVTRDPILAAFRRQLDSAVVMPGTPEMRVVWSPVDMALQKVISGAASPKAALVEAEAEIRRYLDAAKGAKQAHR
jgi:arabinogalactan oligomer/maltooligosaccharide transport system substrate-binding protein